MPFDYSVLPVRYRFGHADTDEVQVRYSYEERVASTSTADVVYRWNIDTDSTRWQRQYGFWANSTQELGNIFPHWHMARHNPGGDTQLFLNAWGMGLDDVSRITLPTVRICLSVQQIYLSRTSSIMPRYITSRALRDSGTRTFC